MKIRFIHYNATGAHTGDDVLERHGKFSTGARIEGFDKDGTAIRENCATIHFPQQGIALDAYFVEAVTFVDGTGWRATPLPILRKQLPVKKRQATPSTPVSPEPSPST